VTTWVRTRYAVWLERRKLRAFEVYVYNYGPYGKWQKVRDENTRDGVWRPWWRSSPDR
jgi:hypothetical protein